MMQRETIAQIHQNHSIKLSSRSTRTHTFTTIDSKRKSTLTYPNPKINSNNQTEEHMEQKSQLYCCKPKRSNLFKLKSNLNEQSSNRDYYGSNSSALLPKNLGKQKLDQEKLTKLLENIKSSSNELV